MIATIGEALVDLIEQPDGRFEPCLGGSVCNFTVGLARQGLPVSYLNPISSDRFGKRFHSLLADNGVHLGCAAASPLPTSLAVVGIDASGSPTYAFYREAVADRDIGEAQLLASLPERCELLHTGGLALVPQDLPKTLALIAAAKARGALVSIDANLRPMVVKESDEYLRGVRAAIRHAHIVKVSDEDVAALGMGEPDLAQLAALLFDDAAIQLVAYTRGAHGAALLTRHRQVELPVPRGLKVADTVGAGDCFHSGLLAYLQRSGKAGTAAELAQLDEATLQGALRHAIAAASINITRIGCDPASWDETVKFSF